MSKRSKKKSRNRNRFFDNSLFTSPRVERNNARKEEILKYMRECSHFCKSKTLQQVIEDYCTVFNKNIKEYRKLYNHIELNNIILI